MTGYPLAAVHGADDLLLALFLNAVDPRIGGVLVRGEKGTAKSTAVRGLAELLPPVAVLDGCRFSCDPDRPDPACPDTARHAGATTRPARLVELPVGAVEDRVLGALDLERVLAHGDTAFRPGLLAAAHRGVLYVDEVNLLADHLVDVLLDAAATGRAHVERENVSVSHAAQFVLVGTMNPEEGDLRPQLLDRFGLVVDVAATREPADRAEVVRRRLAADEDPVAFAARWAGEQWALASRIVRARAALRAVALDDAVLDRVARVCAAFDVDGLRADIVVARTACAHAAWHDRRSVTDADVRVAARLALPHRQRRDPLDQSRTGLDEDRLDDVLGPEQPDDDPQDRSPDDGPDGGGPDDDGPDDDGPDDDGPGDGERPSGGGSPRRAPVAASTGLQARHLAAPGVGSGPAGRRSRARTTTGRTVAATAFRGGPLHVTATVTAGAPHQAVRGRTGGPLVLRPHDARTAVREGREGNLVVLLVDASGSMGARERVAQVKGAVLALLRDAYQRRDLVALLTFRHDGAEVVLPPTSSVDVAARRLDAVATGGRTPLAEGLLAARDLLAAQARRGTARRPLLVVVTDGRATCGDDALGRAARAAALLRGTPAVVVDCESGPLRLHLAERLAAVLGAEHLDLTHLASAPLAQAIRSRKAA